MNERKGGESKLCFIQHIIVQKDKKWWDAQMTVRDQRRLQTHDQQSSLEH